MNRLMILLLWMFKLELLTQHSIDFARKEKKNATNGLEETRNQPTNTSCTPPPPSRKTERQPHVPCAFYFQLPDNLMTIRTNPINPQPTNTNAYKTHSRKPRQCPFEVEVLRPLPFFPPLILPFSILGRNNGIGDSGGVSMGWS
jgi:hypothetical protein